MMKTPSAAVWATVHDICLKALLYGALLGALVWALAKLGEPSAFRVAGTFAILLCGSLAFVGYALHIKKTRPRVTGNVVRVGFGLLEGSVSVTIEGLNALML